MTVQPDEREAIIRLLYDREFTAPFRQREAAGTLTTDDMDGSTSLATLDELHELTTEDLRRRIASFVGDGEVDAAVAAEVTRTAMR